MGSLKLRYLILGLLLISLAAELLGEFHDRKKYPGRLLAPKSSKSNSEPIPGKLRPDDGVFRVVILGGSAAEGFGSEPEKSWSHILQIKLEQKLQSPVEVVNLAKGASTSIDDYVNFVKEGVLLNPDRVIVYSGWNDITGFFYNPGWLITNTGSRLSEIQKDTESYDLGLKLKKKIFLVRKFFQIREDIESLISSFYGNLEARRNIFFKSIRDSGLFPVERFSRSFEATQNPGQDLQFEDLLKDRNIDKSYFEWAPRFSGQIKPLYKKYYEVNLRSLAEFLAERQMKGIFIFQPDLAFKSADQELDPEERKKVERLMGKNTAIWETLVKEYYPLGIQLMQEAARESGHVFLDMNPIARKYSSEQIFHDTVHYTEEGNRVIAEEIFRFLNEKQLLTSNHLRHSERSEKSRLFHQRTDLPLAENEILRPPAASLLLRNAKQNGWGPQNDETHTRR